MHAYGRFYYIESSDLDAKILRIPYDVYNLLSSFFFFLFYFILRIVRYIFVIITHIKRN